jgi:diaminohydroxyphosphoribosylaminopyrimidine deaminase / 5-amino-6-(5-phosphoribosylamino)uracil reductase
VSPSPVQPFTARDRAFMARALELAGRGLDTSHPNPRVGCVLAKDDRILAEGWHERAGGPHAEAAALAALSATGASAAGCTAYVTLEPCSHHGRTPPCAQALIAAGIARAVFAVRDPDPRVDGGGARRLAEAGIRVEQGLLAQEAEQLNEGFMKRMRQGLPFVRLKLAQSLDGRTALSGGESRWISGEAARADVQRWRARSSAVLTGIGTVLADDPRLTVRPGGPRVRQPLRVVLDSRLRLPPEARLLESLPGEGVQDFPDPGVLVFTTGQPARRAALEGRGVRVEATASVGGHVDLRAALAKLAAEGVNEVLAECGAVLGGALLTAGLVDELLIYVAPLLLGPQARPLVVLPEPASLAGAPRFHCIEQQAIGEDVRLRLRPCTRTTGDAHGA